MEDCKNHSWLGTAKLSFELEVCRIEETEDNAVKESDHEESPKTDKLQGNYSLSSLTEKEKEQILQLSKQETLEKGIKYALRHMIKRCKEAGGGGNDINSPWEDFI